MLAEDVAEHELPPIGQRLPAVPSVVDFTGTAKQLGRHGGDLTMLMARTKDTRILYVYGYARLVGYTRDLDIVPDILERLEVADGQRVFTLHLRPGHRWSDGAPFTSEDFRYWWEDVIRNPELSPFGPPAELLVHDEPPTVDILDPTTVRYRWLRPNPYFLNQLAGAKPDEIYLPAHYLKRFHKRYADPEELAERVERAHQKSWVQLHNRLDNLSEFDNPDLPTLQPWRVATAAPASRFVFVRNPYYHRVDSAGRQLPYIDRIMVDIADSRIIPTKTGAGESDLQARYLRFDNYTFLKQAETRNHYRVRLWRTGIGAQIALFPNLNAADPQWRRLNRDVRFRRALSLGIDREEINQVIYYGLAVPSNNTVLERSPLWRADYRDRWAAHDPAQANALLDEIGLHRDGRNGPRRMPNGEPVQIVVESAGESTEEVDTLELIADGWRKLGIRLFTKPLQLEVLRNRIYAGETVMSIARGLDNAIPTAAMSPGELVPIDQAKYQWPKWGQYFQTMGHSGEPPDLPAAKTLLDLREQWENADDNAERREIWHRILEITADQQFTLGIVNGVPQPVVVRDTLHNVPEAALFNYEPGAHFGLCRPDTFWFESRDGASR
ncbi:MAG: ABC transporter substrate-binding protein [Azospirillum sp.]|nr:ABC transporter substrate-binding protein [Azospirillum sp.]